MKLHGKVSSTFRKKNAMNDKDSKKDGFLDYGESSQPETSSNEEKYVSRKERRHAETTSIPVVPAAKTDSDVEPLLKSIPSMAPPVLSSFSNKIPTVSTVDSMSSKVTTPVPDNRNNVPDPRKQKVTKEPSEYWGGTALLYSLIAFLVATVVSSALIVVWIVLETDLIAQAVDGNVNTIDIEAEVGVPLILSQFFMYAAWFFSMWWVTKYRSGMQRGKKFWAAFKDNFRLNNFSWMDLGWGAGIAAVMVAAQFGFLWAVPQLFPNEDWSQAGNSQLFESLEGVTFVLIAFGLGGIIGPTIEELFFRGFMMRGFSNHFSFKNSGRNMDMIEDELTKSGTGLNAMFSTYRGFTHKHRHILAAIVSSVIFGLIHFQGGTGLVPWITVIWTGILGFVFAIVTLKLNRLYPAIFAHILYNSSLFMILALNK